MFLATLSHLREIKICLRVLTLIAGFTVAYFASVVVIPVVAAVFLAVLLAPLVDGLVRYRLSRGLASAIVLVGLLLAGALLGWLGYLSAQDIADTLPSSVERFRQLGAGLYETIGKLEFAGKLTQTELPTPGVTRVEIVDRFPAWTQYLVRGVGSVSEALVVAVFVPMLLLYFLIDKKNLVESSSALLGRGFNVPKIYIELPRMLRAFALGNLLTAAFLVFAHCLVLYALGARAWFALGVISGIVNILPLIGAPLAIALSLFGAAGELGSLSGTLLVSGTFLTAHFVAGNMVLPLVVGSRININSASLVVGLLFWGWYWGAIGFLLAIPMTAAVKILLEANRATVPLANLMAVKPRLFLGSFGSHGAGGGARGEAPEPYEPSAVNPRASSPGRDHRSQERPPSFH